MSTEFTQHGYPIIESRSLGLVLGSGAARAAITEYCARLLRDEGYEDVSPSMLNFLAALDCGVNYGSEIARRLQVSRQMVAKTVKELCRSGYLEQIEGKGKQKQILFTASGEKLMSDVRRGLARLDEVLAEEVGEAELAETIARLDRIQALIGTGRADARYDLAHRIERSEE